MAVLLSFLMRLTAAASYSGRGSFDRSASEPWLHTQEDEHHLSTFHLSAPDSPQHLGLPSCCVLALAQCGRTSSCLNSSSFLLPRLYAGLVLQISLYHAQTDPCVLSPTANNDISVKEGSLYTVRILHKHELGRFILTLWKHCLIDG